MPRQDAGARSRSPHNHSTSADQDLIVSIHGDVGYVTFNRPAVRNAFTARMHEQMADLFETLSAERSLRALVLTGSGGLAFCSGADISEFDAFKNVEDALAYEARVERTLVALERCPFATIAAVNGYCTGAGAAVASCCDVRIATRNAQFGFPIARTLGNCLSPANYARFSSIVGPSRMKEMIFTARLLDAEEALQVGLVSQILDSNEALTERAKELAITIAAHAPLTIQATKEALRRLHAHVPFDGDMEHLIRCYSSNDFREGQQAFLSKRKPKFQGS